MVGYYFLNQSCVKMQKIPSAFLVSLSTESFIICMMMHTKRTCKYNMRSFSENSTVDRTHLFLVTLSFQAFRNTVCSCMHSSMKYFPALKECVQSNKHRANIFYSRNCDFIMLCITSQTLVFFCAIGSNECPKIFTLSSAANHTHLHQPFFCSGRKGPGFPVDGSHWVNMNILIQVLHSGGHEVTVVRTASSW